MINSDKVWGLFENKNQKEEIFDYTQHPAYGLLMFKKILENTENIQLIFNNIVGEKSINSSEIIQFQNNYIYLNAWDYLSKVDVDDENTLEAIKLFVDSSLLKYLIDICKFFEEKEEYEKCAFIKKIETSLKNNVASPKDLY